MVNDTNVFISNYADGKITSMIYSDDDIVCEDADGDGYYFWGVGEKPASCPGWIPDIPDGNDADPSYGSLDSYGFLEPLYPDSIPTIVFSNDSVFTTRQSICSNIRILQGATVTVKDILNMFGHSTIIIETGGKLIVDNGVITNANIDMRPGSELHLFNEGILVNRTNCCFIAPSGAIVEVQSGKINNSNDF